MPNNHGPMPVDLSTERLQRFLNREFYAMQWHEHAEAISELLRLRIEIARHPEQPTEEMLLERIDRLKATHAEALAKQRADLLELACTVGAAAVWPHDNSLGKEVANAIKSAFANRERAEKEVERG